MRDRDLTLAAIAQHGWWVVLLAPGTKQLPRGTTWGRQLTHDPTVISPHLDGGGGIGLAAHASGVAVVDVDKPDVFAAMTAEGGALRRTSESPSGGFHCYVLAIPGLPAQIKWRGQVVGEVLRGPHQQSVMPPSPYPGNAKKGVPPGGFYRWLVDPREPLPELPEWWRDHLIGQSPVASGARRPNVAQTEPWCGPGAETLITRALMQPGAVRRTNGVKFQSPGCAAEGHDRSRDNALVRDDGRFGCALNTTHRTAIAEALGLTTEKPRVSGYDGSVVRRLGLRL
jgi:hypothetical protein